MNEENLENGPKISYTGNLDARLEIALLKGNTESQSKCGDFQGLPATRGVRVFDQKFCGLFQRGPILWHIGKSNGKTSEEDQPSDKRESDMPKRKGPPKRRSEKNRG